MWSPPKPWEIPSNNFRNLPPTSTAANYRPARGVRQVRRTNMAENDRKTAPALPPRPASRQTQSYSNYGYGNYGGFGGHMGPYSGGYTNGYGGGYGGYGGHNGYNNMYGGYTTNRYGTGYNNAPSSSFVDQAEQNSRIAFDSVHSIVQAFGSIAMMLESTFFAVHSSFRAVLGVADHFSRLRENLVQIVGSNFVIKWLQSLFRKIMVLIGLRSSASVEEVWNEMRSMTRESTRQGQSRVWKSWPLLLFFGVVLGTPWLIWRFLSSLGDEDAHNWMTGDGDHVVGEVLYDFVAEGEDELSITAGECIKIAPKQRQPRIRGWLLATVDGNSKGIVPANYIKILGFKRGRKVNTDAEQKSSVPSSGEQECDDAGDRTVDLDDVYTETVTSDFETQQFDQDSDELTHEHQSDSEITEETNGSSTSRTIQ